MPANVGVGCSTCDRSLTLSPWGRVTQSGPGHWLLGWWWSTQRVSAGAFSCRRRTAACCCRIASIHLQEIKKTDPNCSKNRTEKNLVCVEFLAAVTVISLHQSNTWKQKVFWNFFATFLEFHLFFGCCSGKWASTSKKIDRPVEFKRQKFFFFGQIAFLCCNKPKSLCTGLSWLNYSTLSLPLHFNCSNCSLVTKLISWGRYRNNNFGSFGLYCNT